MALRPFALITVDEAKKFIRTSRTNIDQTLETLINGASAAIRAYAERELKPRSPALDSSAPESRRFLYDGSGYLNLAPYDLRSLGGAGFGGTGSVTLYSDLPTADQRPLLAGSPTVEGEYRLGPRNKTPELTYLSLDLPVLKTGSYLYEVAIAGYWGCAEVPPEAEIACLITVREWLNNPGGARELAGQDGVSVVIPGASAHALPPEARSALDPLRRVALA